MKYIIVALVAFMPTAAFARSDLDKHAPDFAPAPPSEQRDAAIYAKGYCDALGEAIKASWANRDHWRRLLDKTVPFETRDEVLKKLADKDYKPTFIDSVDQYVVFPEAPFRAVGVTLPDGNMVVCPAVGTEKK
jgi:hypothetical protein